MAGIDTIRGVTFQLVQTLSDVVDLVADDRGAAVVIEGAADVVDYEVLDDAGQPIAIRQVKSRREPATWGATELARILCAWGEVDDAADAEFAFVTDASLNESGHRLNELIMAMRMHPDEDVLRQRAAALRRGGVLLPRLDVVRRVQILSRMGTVDSVLARVEMQILALLSRARLATPEDAVNAANALLRRLFVVGGNVDLSRRIIGRADVLETLGLDEASLLGDAEWSFDRAQEYRAAVVYHSRRVPGFVPLQVAQSASVPFVLRLMLEPTQTNEAEQSLEAVLAEQSAVLVGAAGQGKSTALMHLAGTAAERGFIPVALQAAGHVQGSLPRRVRRAIEARLGRSLTAGAVQHVMAAPDLMLLIDGVSEVDAGTRAGLSADLRQMAAQRPVRVIAAGRDLPLTIAGAALPDGAGVFRITGLDSGSRRAIAAAHGRQDYAVTMIERRLGGTADNPMLFLMALSLSGEDFAVYTRAEVYEQFLRGLAARARMNDDDISLAALGAGWAQMIGRNMRTADHYTWRSVLGAALDELAARPVWRAHTGNAGNALDYAQRMGLLTRLDLESGLAPLHDSFADFLAARSIVRHEAGLPSQLNAGYDETMLFMVEMAGLEDALALRIAAENPMLACRIARQPQARGHAEAEQTGLLLEALAGGRHLPLLAEGTGLRLCHHEQFTGVVLVGDCRETVDPIQFYVLAREHPALTVPTWTGSLQLAVRLWASAVGRAQRPATRVFRPAPPADPEQAISLLQAYIGEVEDELRRLCRQTLPDAVSDRVLAALGPRSITAWVGDPVPGVHGGKEIPVQYQRSANSSITRGQPPADTGPWGQDTFAGIMRLHPTQQAAREIGQALSVLSSHTWPTP